MNHRMIVGRETEDETAFAVIHWSGPDRKAFWKALQKAVTRWADAGGEVAEGSIASDGSLTVADLADFVSETELQVCLEQEGITHLEIEIYSDGQPNYGHTYDENLYRRKTPRS